MRETACVDGWNYNERSAWNIMELQQHHLNRSLLFGGFLEAVQLHGKNKHHCALISAKKAALKYLQKGLDVLCAGRYCMRVPRC